MGRWPFARGRGAAFSSARSLEVGVLAAPKGLAAKVSLHEKGVRTRRPLLMIYSDPKRRIRKSYGFRAFETSGKLIATRRLHRTPKR